MKGLAPLMAAAMVGVVGEAGAQATDAEREAAMARTVLAQLQAFRQGDWARAYGFAAAGIQAQFTLEAFRQMVTGGYAPIARPARSTILGTRLLAPDRGYVEVRVEGQDGQTIEALYELVDEQGQWRVNGVLARPADPGIRAGHPGDPDPAALGFALGRPHVLSSLGRW